MTLEPAIAEERETLDDVFWAIQEESTHDSWHTRRAGRTERVAYPSKIARGSAARYGQVSLFVPIPDANVTKTWGESCFTASGEPVGELPWPVEIMRPIEI